MLVTLYYPFREIQATAAARAALPSPTSACWVYPLSHPVTPADAGEHVDLTRAELKKKPAAYQNKPS